MLKGSIVNASLEAIKAAKLRGVAFINLDAALLENRLPPAAREAIKRF